MSGGCCTPRRGDAQDGRRLQTLPPERVRSAGPRAHSVEQVKVAGGIFAMGDSLGDGVPADGEQPVHQVQVSPFEIDATTVTNADFTEFIEATGYSTDAERLGFSAVFHLALAADEGDILGQPAQTPWWLGVRGADWRHPGGRRSDISSRADHPVVHVSWNDANAYSVWAGRRLPTEAEWEFASRGGLPGARYPWGDELMAPDGTWQTNIWQGTFPTENTSDDGFITTAPVRTFRPNAYGLWQSVGNVWEWCEDGFSPSTYSKDAALGLVKDPRGAATGTLRVMRGGSYLCHDSYCNRYRNAARTSNTPDSSMGNTGFRTVAA
ncbi:MAG TPA: formylglycine-generating enzyme family protein [Sinomonas sp.]|nr:formylglycine-generating enzyme family protein [Sinomonas sp.]